VWSWAASDRDVAERREHADGLMGEQVVMVRYVNIDYRREELHPDLLDAGVRIIEDAGEVEHPTWRCDGFDAVDYGIELETSDGATWSLTWDPPGDHEGIGLRKEPLIGSAVSPDASVAVWEVAGSPLWSPITLAPIEGIQLHYFPWDPPWPSFWCPRISLVAGDSRTEIIMGDEEDGRLVPSATNVAILAPETRLPTWSHLTG
jgi:hypothetical protein